VRGFFGRLNTHPPGEAYTDSAFRAILFTRLCECAEPESIVVSAGVHDLCRGKGISFADRRSVAAKGFDKPIEAYEVHWRIS
jgi:hypothetical protein